MTTEVKRLVRRVFREEVKEHLIRAILRGDLQPGDRIVELRIAEELGVSQGPVREALRELELLGFVESAPFKGTQVCDVPHEELGQLYPLRATVEAMAVRAAAARITEAQLAEMERLLDTMHEAAQGDDRRAQVEQDIAFHRIIVEASGSRLLRRFWDGMQLHATTFLTLAVTRRDLHDLAERHRSLLTALRARDAAAAEAAVRRHIEEPGAWVAEILQHAPRPSAEARADATQAGR
jgi:DNA-binding GntR family transcriptional regulator